VQFGVARRDEDAFLARRVRADEGNQVATLFLRHVRELDPKATKRWLVDRASNDRVEDQGSLG
jgi:hypothetical protein